MKSVLKTKNLDISLATHPQNTCRGGASYKKLKFCTLFSTSLVITALCVTNVFAAESINLTISGNVNLNLVATDEIGQFAKSSNLTASVTTTNNSGYTLTIAGKDNTGQLKGRSTSTNLNSIPSPLLQTTFEAHTEEAKIYNDKWGLLSSKYQNTDGDIIDNTSTNPTYLKAPISTTPTVIDITTTANTTPVEYSLAIGARANTNTPSDNFSNTFILASTANPTNYSIGFVDATNNMPATIADSTNGDSVTLPSEVPKKAFHKFMGWCSTYTNTSSCSGTLYQPGASYNLSNGATTNLYAVWQQITDRSMQNVLEWGDTLSEGDEVVSYDTRDNRAYTVGKLPDGNVWLLDNLAFDGKDSSGTYIEMNSSNTNITGTRTAKWTSSVANGYQSYADPFIFVTKKDKVNSSDSLENARSWKYGALYNYCAATANNPSTCVEFDTTVATDDICPAGWRMPSYTELTQIYNKAGGSGQNTSDSTIVNKFRNMLHAPIAGQFVSGSSVNADTGYFWSNTSDSLRYRYVYFYREDLVGLNDSDKSYGSSVRCIKKEKTMQNVALWKNSLSEGENIQVKDERDNKVYWVGKQADGNIWMTQNLDFEITSEPLTSETSDLTAYNTGGYTSVAGYTQVNGIIKWTPASTAITSNAAVPVSTATGDTISGVTGWTNGAYAPYSVEGGDVYVYTSNSSSNDIIYTSLSSCAFASHTEAECKHYHRGNYYNWNAAIAHNNTENVAELNTQYNIAANSICPAGWKLPVGQNSATQDATTMQFGNLMYASGINYSVSSTTFKPNGLNNIRTNPLFFVRSGMINKASLYKFGMNGSYWSSSVNGSNYVHIFSFNNLGYVYPISNAFRSYGFSMRCVAR